MVKGMLSMVLLDKRLTIWNLEGVETESIPATCVEGLGIVFRVGWGHWGIGIISWNCGVFGPL